MNALYTMILRLRQAALFLLLQMLLTPMYAQFGHYISFGNREGMPSDNIYQLLEDTDGFIWIGTNRGLVRYDGRNFRTFTTKDGLPANDIWQMEITSDGKVWYICRSKRWGYIWKDKVYSFPVAAGMVPSSFTFYFDEDNLRFEGTKLSGPSAIGIYALKNNIWQYEDSLELPWSIRGAGRDLIGVMLPAGRVLYNTPDSVFVTDLGKKWLFTLRNRGSGPQLTSFNEIGIGRLWKGYLMMYMDKEYATLYDFRAGTFISRKLFDSSKTQIFQAYPEYQRYGEHYYQASKYNQFVIVDSNLNFIEKHNLPEIYPAAHILKDRGGNYWMAGPQGGLSVFPHYSFGVRRYFSGQKVIITYQSGKELIVVAGSALYMRPNGDTAFTRIKHHIDLITDVGGYAPQNLYYMGGRSGTMFGSDLEKLKERRYVMENVSGGKRLTQYPNLKAMIRLPDSSYAAVSGARLLFFDKELWPKYHFVHGPQRHWIYGARKLLYWNGRLYIGGDGMHWLYNDSVQVVPGLPESMQKGITYLVPFSKRYMLVGTDGSGVYLYDGAQRAFPVSGSEGFVINKIVLHKRSMWIATDNGVHRIEPVPGGSRLAESFYVEDGLLSNNVNSIDFTGDTLWVAQDQGLVALNVHRGNFHTQVHPSLYTRDAYRLNDSTYALTYGDLENIELDFGVLALPVQRYMTYSFKIGDDAEWFSSATTTLSLGKLSPGERYIYFRATDQHGNSGQFRLLLQVRPLWYQTLWAKAGLVLLLVLLVISITLVFRLRAERRQKAALSLKGRMSELELQALRSQMNPHFVFNSLNAIQFFVIKNKVELSEAYLAKFSKLVRMFFEYSRYDSLRLDQEIDLLERYLEIEKLRFEDKLSYRVEVDERLDTEEMEIPSMILQPIVENAVNHGIFHKKGNGRVEVVFSYIDENSVRVRVKDDGVGINVMKEMYRNETRNYRSRSSEVLKERLKILSENKLSRWRVIYSIRDLSEESPGLTGTQVDIEFIYKPERPA